MSEELSIEDADRQIRELEPWIVRAAAALLTLWSDERGYERFDRDTTTRYDTPVREPVPAKGRVSSALALPALMDYRRFLEECPESLSDEPDFAAILGGEWPMLGQQLPSSDYVERVVCRTAQRMEKWCQEELFKTHTSTQYLYALTALALYQHAHFPWHDEERRGCPPQADGAVGYKVMQGHLEAELPWVAGTVDSDPDLARHGNRDNDEPNYYVTFTALRSRDVCGHGNQKDDNRIWDLLGRPVRLRLSALVGERLGHTGTESTVADVAFAAALLDRLEEENAARLVDRAVELVIAEQRPDGSWPCPPIISKDESVLEITSYDIAFGLACLLLNQFARDRHDNGSRLLASFRRVFELVRLSQQTVRTGKDGEDSFVGWASDGSRSPQVVTAYVTSRVVSFLIRYRDALLAYRQSLVLSKYSVSVPPPIRQTLWQDVQLSLNNEGTQISVSPRPAQSSSNPLYRIHNPFDDFDLPGALDRIVAQPVENSAIKRPRADGVSFFLTGPPGTGKTTLVELLAERLQWPLMVLSPPDFLREGGLASILGVATEVFSDLLRLRRVVLLLDECEELFRNRQIGSDSLKEENKVGGVETKVGGDETEAGGEETRARGEDATKTDMRLSPHGTGGDRTEGAFLTAAMLPRLQQLHDRQWAIFALATNVADPDIDLDEAALRRGRFDFEIQMPRPEPGRRKEYLGHELTTLRRLSPKLPAELMRVIGARTDGSGYTLNWPDLDELKREVDRWANDFVSDPKDAHHKILEFRDKCEKFIARKSRKRGTRDIRDWPDPGRNGRGPNRYGKSPGR